MDFFQKKKVEIQSSSLTLVIGVDKTISNLNVLNASLEETVSSTPVSKPKNEFWYSLF